MSTYSIKKEHLNSAKAEKIATMINESEDEGFRVELLPILEKYAENSGGLFSEKRLGKIRKEINDSDWSY